MDSEQIQLEIKNENAFIEIHYKEDNIDIINLEDLIKQSNLELNKTYNLIKIPKEYTKKEITLKFDDINLKSFTIYKGYIKPPYTFIYNIIKDNNTFEVDSFNLDIDEYYKNNIQLMEGEIYSIMIHKLNNNIKLNIKIEAQKDEENKGDENKGIKAWEIILIAIGTIIAIFLITIVIMYFFGKRKTSNKDIKEKVQALNEFEDI